MRQVRQGSNPRMPRQRRQRQHAGVRFTQAGLDFTSEKRSGRGIPFTSSTPAAARTSWYCRPRSSSCLSSPRSKDGAEGVHCPARRRRVNARDARYRTGASACCSSCWSSLGTPGEGTLDSAEACARDHLRIHLRKKKRQRLQRPFRQLREGIKRRRGDLGPFQTEQQRLEARGLAQPRHREQAVAGGLPLLGLPPFGGAARASAAESTGMWDSAQAAAARSSGDAEQSNAPSASRCEPPRARQQRASARSRTCLD